MKRSSVRLFSLILIFSALLSFVPMPMISKSYAQVGELPEVPTIYKQIRYFTDWFAVQPLFFYNNYDKQTYDGLIELSTPSGNYHYYSGQYDIITKYGNIPVRYLQSSPRIVDEQIVGQYTADDGNQIFIKAFTVEWDQCLYTMVDGENYFGASPYGTKTVSLCKLTISSNFNSASAFLYIICEILGGGELCQVFRAMAWAGSSATDTSYIEFPHYSFGGYYDTDDQVSYFDNVSLSKKVDGLLFTRLWATTAQWQDLFEDAKVSSGEYFYQNKTWIAIRGTIIKNWKRGIVESGLDTIVRTFETGYETQPIDERAKSYVKYTVDPGGDTEKGFNGVVTQVRGYYQGPVNFNGTDEGDFRQWGAYIYNDPINTLLPTYQDINNPDDPRTDITYWGAKNYSTEMHDFPMSSVVITQNYVLRPQTRLFLTHHKYHYEHGKTFLLVTPDVWGIPTAVDPIPAGFESENRIEEACSGWETKNAYSLTTLQTQVMVGAYYNWTAYSGIGGPLEPPNSTTTDNIFSAIPTGAYEALLESPEIPLFQEESYLTWIFIIIGVVIALVVIYLVYRWYSGRSKTVGPR